MMFRSVTAPVKRFCLAAVPLLLISLPAVAETPVVIDFEDALVLLPNDLPYRAEQVVEKGVVFKLAHPPQESKAKGVLTYFIHISSGHKGILCAMALEPIPVQATFPEPVSSVTVALWGSTATPALLEAFDAEGNVVDRVQLDSIPGRTAPEEPVPIFTMTVRAPRIAYIQWSGPREGEYLAADEVRFTPVEDGR